jgi:hypothetical protein
LQALLDALVQLAPAPGEAVDPHAVGDVLENRFWKGVRLLEDHADAASQRDDVDAAAVDVLSLDRHASFDPRARDDVVHPIQRAQKRALAAA